MTGGHATSGTGAGRDGGGGAGIGGGVTVVAWPGQHGGYGGIDKTVEVVRASALDRAGRIREERERVWPYT